MKDKIKRQKNFTIIELKFENAPGISDGDCSHYKIKNEGQFPSNNIFDCPSLQLGTNCCSHCMIECNPNFAS